jgi:plastocyanin
MQSLKIGLALAFMAGASVALAAERTISQKGKMFSESAVQIKKGDSLVFLNDDNVVHNVLSTTPGSVFNLGSIAPGHSTPVTFDKVGDLQVLCAIHPSMKMSVKVAE